MALTVTPAELTATALTLTTAAQPNITSVGTLTTLTVDDITINGSTISDAGEFTLDIGGDINIDADGGDINFKDGGTLFGQISNSSGLYLVSNISDADIFIRGNDGGSYVNALTFDMSAGGNATFAGEVTFNKDIGLGMNGAAFGTGVPTINFKGTSNSNTRAGALLFKENNDDDVAALYVTDGQDGYGTVLAAYQGDIKFSTGTLAGYKMTIASTGIVTIRPDTGATTGTLRLHNGNGHSSNVSHGSIQYTGNMDFFTGGSSDSRFFVGMHGEIGINTSSPEHHLHVTEPGSSKEDGIVKIGGSGANLGLELRYNQSGATSTDIIANPTYSNAASLMRICVDGDDNPNQIVLTGAGTVSMGEFSTTDYRDGRLHTGLQGSGNDLRVTAAGNAHVDISAVTSNSAYVTINSGESRLNNDAGYLAFGHNTNHSVPAFVAYIMHRSRGATNQGYFDFYNRNSSGTAIHAARIDGDDSNGLYSRTGNVSNLSDQRLKKNIQDLTYSMDEFKALKPRTFEWINTGDHPEGVQNGFVAQELPEHLKSTYDIGQKTGPLEEDIDPDYALVKDENGIGTAFAASLGSNDAMYVSIIQQLIARIEALENN